MANYFIVPGSGNSGPEHSQTNFEKSGETFKRINQQKWESPVCKGWIHTIDDALLIYDLVKVILIEHSLGCAAIAHWASKYNKIIKGALLVAPGDVGDLAFPEPIKGFSPMPKQKINFKTIVVASEDDLWVRLDRARYFADCWGSEFINTGKAGHINVASGYGAWKQGLEKLRTIE